MQALIWAALPCINMFKSTQSYVKRLFSSGSTFDKRYLEWAELIHHAAVYTDYLIIIPANDIDDRVAAEQALSHLHSGSFDVAHVEGTASLEWMHILNSIKEAIGCDLELDEALQLSEALRQSAEERYATSGNLLVSIGNSQQISSDVLNQIAHFALLSQRYIVFVLFGEVGFAEVIREGPAQAMKQYLPDPSQDTSRIVHHERIVDRIRKKVRRSLEEVKSQNPWLVSVLEPVEKGDFPLTHTIAVTCAVVLLVCAALFWPSDKATVIEEVIIPNKPSPVWVDAFSDELADNEQLPVHLDAKVSTTLADAVNDPAADLVMSQNSFSADKADSDVSPMARTITEPLSLKTFYAIQLIGVRDQASAISYMRQWQAQLKLPMGYLETSLKGAPWYVVVCGHFKEHDQAKAAITAMPLELRSNKPWVRQVDTEVSWL